jgi:6-phosphogluconate dehydrogenase
MVGLGKMGGGMALRLLRGGHAVIGYDLLETTVAGFAEDGLTGAHSLEELAGGMEPPRHVWIMVPAGATVDATIGDLLPLLSPGDVLIDGGNSDYRNTIRRARELEQHEVALVDAGTSGGVWGLDAGYCLMVGGPSQAVEGLAPAFDTLAYDGGAGWGHVGPAGAGHFVKMVHNGIEYGMMQAYAEGFAVLEAKKEFELDLHGITQIWRHGSVVRSWLLDLTASLLEADPDLSEIAPFVPDSGEGRWTVREAIDLDVPAPVITTSLIQRLQSRDARAFGNRVLAGMRNQFGGHAVRRPEDRNGT